MKRFAVIALVINLATGAFAHSKMDKTSPADGATIADVPSVITLNFAKDIRLTRVEMVHQEQPSVQLDLDGQTRFDRAFTLPLQGMGAGIYHIQWRGLGTDGHAMQGLFSFTVE
jgi:copper resistance protein C